MSPTARSATRTATDRTWTDGKGVTHDVRNGGYYTRCDREIPADLRQIMPGWPAPPERDRVPGVVTCIECVAMEDT